MYIVLMILAILGWGVGCFFYKIAGNHGLQPFMISAIATLVYMIETPLPFLFLKFDRSWNWLGVACVAAGALCMTVGSLGYFFALKKGDAGVITAVTAIYPAVTLALSLLFLGEGFTIRKGIGIGLAILSMFIIGWK